MQDYFMTYNRRLTYSSMLIMIAYSSSMTVLPVVLSDLILQFSISSSQAGMMSSLISLGALSALVSSTYLQGRVRKSSVIVLAGVAASTVLVIISFSRSFAFILPCFYLQGFFLSGFLDPNVNAFMIDLNPANSGRYVSVLHALYGTGGLIAPLVFQQVIRHSGWQGVYLAAAAFLFMLTLPLGITGIKAGRESVPVIKKDSKLTLKTINEFFSKRRNLLLLTCMFFYSATQNTHVLWIIRYMTTVLNNSGYGAIALSGFWVCCTICRFVMPYVPGKPMLKFALGLLPGAVFLALGFLSGSALLLIVASCVFGLFGGHSIPTLVNECARQYPGATTFPSMLMFLSMHIASTIMAVLIGMASARFSLQYSIIILPFLASLASISGFVFLVSQRGKDMILL